MIEHTTHFYDCGCQSAAYEGQLQALIAEVEELQHQRTRVLEMHYEFNPDGHARGLCHGCDYSWPCPTVGVYRTVTR